MALPHPAAQWGYHGSIIHWIETGGRLRLGIMPRPSGASRLDSTMVWLREQGVDVLVSLLTSDQVRALKLEDEAGACKRAGIDFRAFPIVDHSVPTPADPALSFARGLLGDLQAGRAVVVHCLAGIGRSGLLAATIMMMAGFERLDACDRITSARGIRCPETHSQRAWLASIEDRA